LKQPFFPKMMLALGKTMRPAPSSCRKRIAQTYPFKQIPDYIGSAQ